MYLDILIPGGTAPLDWKPTFARLTALLKPHRIATRPLLWTAPEACDTDVVIALLAWGYHTDPARWSDLLARRQTRGLTLNPASAMTWNTDKRYLRDVARHAPTVPTIYVDHLTDTALDGLRADLRSETLIVKPRVGASAEGVMRISGVRTAPCRDVMVQPYLPGIVAEGEISLIFFAGRFSHAVRKRAAAGEFRVQSEFGGSVEPVMPTRAMRSVAEAALGAVPAPIVYARIDLVPDLAGTWVVIEIELIEPELFLGHAPDGGQALADAIAAALGAAQSSS